MQPEFILGDCQTGLSKYPDGYFDLLIADPGYGINAANMAYIGNHTHLVKQKNGTQKRVSRKNRYAPKDWDIYPPDQSYFDEVKRVSKHQIIWGINHFCWDGVGNGRIIWDKCVPAKMSFKKYEYAYCSLINHEYQFKYLWSGMQQGKSLKEPTTPRGDKSLNEVRIHPTQKPKVLYEFILRTFAQPGWKILDTHVGSGSSMIVSYKLNFDYTGFEIDPDYYAGAMKRFKNEVYEPLFIPGF